MKFTIILLFAIIQVNAASYAQRISLKVKDASIESVFKMLRKQSNYNFYYPNELVQKAQPITLSVTDEPFIQVLNKCFEGQPFTYTIKRNTVVVSAKAPDISNSIQADIVVTGKVLDQDNKAIPGVSVKQKGTNTAVVTSPTGEYTIKVHENATLIFSYVGYLTQEIQVNNRKVITVNLLSSSNQLNDVVVVAYGQKQRKIETLGAQSSLNVEDLKQPVANISTVLAGRISGLVGMQRSGEPGRDGANLWIRGVITTGDNSPLILVDGVQRDFNNLDPDDIEGFTILKDASSTSVYGVKGANGVILITTKKGRAGRTDINMDYYQGITKFTRIPSTADGVTYMQMANEASVTRGGQPVYSQDLIRHTYQQDDPYLYPNVKWMDEIFNNFGHNRKANLNIRGGTEKAKFYLSTGYYDEEGLFKVDALQKYNSSIKYSRVNFSSAVTLMATKSTTIDLGIKGWISNGNYPGTGTNDIFYMALKTYPILYPKMYPDGKEPFHDTGGQLYSPYALLTNRGYQTTYQNQILSNLSVNQDMGSIIKGLSARMLYSFDANNTNSLSRIKNPPKYYATSRDENGNLIYSEHKEGTDYLSFSRSNGGDRQYYFEAALNYANTFGRSKVSGMLLFNKSDKVSAIAGDLIGSIPYRSLGSVGRVTYSYDDRYLSEATFGYNGAEAFAPGKRYGFFPSFALGWVLSNEKFYGNLKNVFQLFKLRASYGIVGSSNLGGRRFAYVGTVGGTTGFSYGQDRGNYIDGIDIQDYPVDATWETEKDLNLGLEFKAFNNALYIQADVFNRRRENIFLSRKGVPDFVGIRNNLLGNLGITNAKGIDLTADFNKRIGELDMTVRGTFTYNKNKWIEDDTPSQPYPWLESRGQSVFNRFGYIAEGYYTAAEIADPKVARTTGIVQPGDIKFKDLNGDGLIDQNDRQVIGRDQVPQIIYGFGTTLAYKGFSLGAFFQGTALVDFYINNDFLPFRNGSAFGGLYSNITDRWTPEIPSQTAFYPRLSYGADINQNYADNSHWIKNGRFLRLKTLDFGYTFSKDKVKRFGAQNLRLYFVGYNLLTISPFKMWDPELGGGKGTTYPNIKTFSLGMNVTF